jgi:hypothetical protein
VLYGSEFWTLSEYRKNQPGIWERKILRRISGLVKKHGRWRIRTNAELELCYKTTSIVTMRLEWAGHVQRKSNQRAVKKVYESSMAGRRCRGRPRLRWIDDVEEDLRSMGVKRWRKRALDSK